MLQIPEQPTPLFPRPIRQIDKSRRALAFILSHLLWQNISFWPSGESAITSLLVALGSKFYCQSLSPLTKMGAV